MLFFVFWAADIFFVNRLLRHAMQPIIEDRRLLPILRQSGGRRAAELRRRRDAVPQRPIFWRWATWRTSCASGCTATSPTSTSTATSIRRTCASPVAGCARSARRRAIRRPTRCRSSRSGNARATAGSEAVTEFHIVGGLHPELTLDWYCEMLRGLKERFPQVHLKAFTMVEIAYLAQRAKMIHSRDAASG